MESTVLRELARKVQAIELGTSMGSRQRSRARASAVATGWPGADELPLVRRGTLHEWFGLEGWGRGGRGGGWAPGGWAPRGWAPPLAVLVHLAWAALEGQGGQDGTAGEVLWIGRRVWPYPYTLVREGGRDRRLLARSLFVDPDRDASRLWAIDLALRCPGVAAVVADGHGLRMPETRRLQLAARSGDALALLARPPGERRRLSAASTRWAVRAEPSPGPTPAPRWNLRLLRSKDVPRAKQEPRSWSLEWDHAKSALVVPPVLVLGPRKKTAAPRRRTPAREHACARQPA